MLLTDEERRRFREWLLQDAESNRLILGQLEGLPGLQFKAVAEMKKAEVAAELIVAKMLDVETMTITHG